MPLDECSAAMGFQVGLKGVGFFAVIKSNRIFDTPRTEFGCVRHIAFVMFFKAGFQIFGTADVEIGSGCFIHENINVMEVRHWKKSWTNRFWEFVALTCIISSLPRPGFICFADYAAAVFPLPSSCFALRRGGFARLRPWLAEAKSQKCRLAKALPQWVFK